MNRFLRLTPRNQSLLQSLTPEEKRAAWNTINLVVQKVKALSGGASQMSDNSAIELLYVLGMWDTACANAQVHAGLKLAHRNKVTLHD